MSALRRGGCVLVGALLAAQLGGSPISRSADQIKRSAERPLPSAAPRSIERGTGVWIPDRWAPYPGEPGGVFVPGHWELRLPDGSLYSPPVTIERRSEGVFQTLPGGVSERQEP